MYVRSSHPLLRATALAATLALFGPAAMAQVSSMVASGSYALEGAAPTLLSDVYPANPSGFVNVLAYPSGSASTGALLHSYGSTTGNFGSRSSGYGVYQVSGGFKLIETITNNSAVAQSAKFTFSITPGMLQNDIGASLGAGQYVEAGLQFDLRKNGSSIWGSSASLRTDHVGTTSTFGGDASLYAGGGTMYQVLGVSREIDLGVINAGQSIELSYELTTFSNGVSSTGPDRWVEPTTFTVPEGWYVYGECGYAEGYGCGHQPPGTVIDVPGYFVQGRVSSSHASSGDPFSINFGPDDKFSASVNPGPGSLGEVIFQPVPEPATYALMLGGLGILGWAARRRSKPV